MAILYGISGVATTFVGFPYLKAAMPFLIAAFATNLVGMALSLTAHMTLPILPMPNIARECGLESLGSIPSAWATRILPAAAFVDCLAVLLWFMGLYLACTQPLASLELASML